MRRANLLYLMGMLVIALCMFAGPAKGMAAYRDYVGTSNAGGLDQPAKVAVDQATGDVYVTDAGNKAVKKYDVNGNYVSGFSLSVAGTPVGIAVNDANILVGDDTNDCVWIYNKSGVLTDLWSTGTSHKLGGASGTALKMPNTIAFAPSGHIFVVDGDSDKVYIYNTNGLANSNFGVSGTTSSGTTIQVYYPSGIAMADSSTTGTTVTQYFYLGDQGNYKVQKLYYKYDNITKLIGTAPTYVSSVGTGTRSDAFGSFLRVSDVAWDSVYSRLIVLDSLQMVGQVFDSNGATTNTAFNYSGGMQGYLNVPTGAATYIDGGKGIHGNTLFVANNQGYSLVSFSMSDGAPPAITALSPASDVTPSTTPYTVNYTVTDSDSAAVTMNFYYYDTASPSNKIAIGTQTAPITGGTYSGSINWSWAVAPGPAVGSYKVYATAVDEKSNIDTADSAGNLLVVTPYDGCSAYTNAHFALYGSAASDFDGDTLSNCAEISGSSNTAYGNAPTNMGNRDTDGDGLDDAVECGTKNLSTNLPLAMAGAFTVSANPNNADTDGGGASDAVELVKGTNVTTGSDDLVIASSPQELVLSYFHDDGVREHSTLSFTNIGTSPIVFDIVYYNPNGSVNIKAPAAYYLEPKKSVYFDPSVKHGANEGSLEVRASAATIAGDVLLYRSNYLDPLKYDDAESSKMLKPSEGATFLMSDTFSDNPDPSRRFVDTVYIKNWADTSAQVTVDYRQNTTGASAAFPYTIAAHEVLILRPSQVLPGSWTGGAIEITSDVPIAGFHNRERFNATDSNTFDIACLFDFVSDRAYTTYSPVWSDSNLDSRRFIGYAYVYNPNSVPINATITFWDNNGLVEGTTTFTNIQPHMKAVFRPTSLVPAPVSPGGCFKIVSTGGDHIGGIFIQRYKLGDVNFMEWSYYMPTAPATSAATVQYASHYRDNAQALPAAFGNRFIDFNYIFNFDPTTVANYTVDYYNSDGSFNKSVSFSINPLSKKTFAPFRNDAGPTDGSMKITCTNGLPFLGYSMGQEFSYGDLNAMDFGFKKVNIK